jgi:DNA polymerase
LAGEIAHCSPWLDRQVELINPQVVVALGSIATKWALGKTSKIGQTRGRFIDWRSRQLMVTYHPSAALRFGPNGMPLAAMREDFALVASLLKGTR